LFLDPQHDGHILRNGTPVTWYDALVALVRGKADSYQFVSSKMSSDDYKATLSMYNGFLSAPLVLDNEKQFVSLSPDTTLQPYLTFQGMAENGTIFTMNRNSLYMPVNNVSISFHSPQASQHEAIIDKYDIDNTAEYMQYLPLFTPGPEFTLKFRNNMPWFSHYELRLGKDGEWIRLDTNIARVLFQDGMNYIRVRGVNEAGVAGSEVSMTIVYK
jgi:hypothetical protein